MKYKILVVVLLISILALVSIGLYYSHSSYNKTYEVGRVESHEVYLRMVVFDNLLTDMEKQGRLDAITDRKLVLLFADAVDAFVNNDFKKADIITKEATKLIEDNN